jgi:hypothetical protein
MKNIKFFLSHTLAELASKPIREKSEVIHLLLSALQEIIFADESIDNNLGYGELLVDKSSRLTFTLQREDGTVHKRFSFSFPFQLIKQPNPELLTTWIIIDNYIEIDSQIISILTSLSNEKWFEDSIDDSSEPLMFYEQILVAVKEANLSIITDKEIWHLVRKLFLFEPGYLRYDFDETDRASPISHPVHHLDIFFSNRATFKLGLFDSVIQKKEWPQTGLENILNSSYPCFYVHENHVEK